MIIKKMFFAALLLLTFHMQSFSQSTAKSDGGIGWVRNQSWQLILKTARSENKYIFVDCFATWCAPCKRMDEEVYTDDKVGIAINSKFIAVKVQMDKTNHDDSEVKSWYKDAETLDQQYKIDAYPTLLFFSPSGKILHRVVQGLNVEGFLDAVSTALDPQKQYYTRIAEYQEGKRDTSIMRDLARSAKAARDKNIALQIADEYLSKLTAKNLYDKEIRDFVSQFSDAKNSIHLATQYINLLKAKEIYLKDNIEFIRKFTKSSRDRGFLLFYKNAKKVNEIIEQRSVLSSGEFYTTRNEDYAQSLVRQIIYSEEFFIPLLKPALESSFKNVTTPDWSTLKLAIQKKYPRTNADRIIVDAKINWYEKSKNWSAFSRSKIQRLDLIYKQKKLIGEAPFINDQCWDIFLRASDTTILNRAIYWMEELFAQNESDRRWSVAIDTYANLLYKTGRVKEALEWEEKAVGLDPSDAAIKDAFEKMRNGLPTWHQQ
jgi:thioredoxin-related protein